MTPTLALLAAQTSATTLKLDNVYDYLVAGGPVMYPLALCSVITLAFAVERWLRLRRGALGSRRFGESIVTAFKSGGAKQALDACATRKNPLARVFTAGLERVPDGVEAVEKAVEDVGSQEVRRLNSSLRPFSIIVTLAPLLGLLGTVIGILIAFSNIAMKQGMGKPELLAGGIAHALITTATGLTIAISALVVHSWFKSRIDAFTRDVEDLFLDVEKQIRASASTPATQGNSGSIAVPS
jgi:biopolymer transport protein ExbB